MISLIAVLLSIDAAATVSIHNIASRLKEKQVPSRRPRLPDIKAQTELHPHASPFHEKNNLMKPYAYPVPPPQNKALGSYSYPTSPSYHLRPFYSQNKPTLTGNFAHPLFVPSTQNHPMISNLLPPDTNPHQIPFSFPFPAFIPKNYKKASFLFPEVELHPPSERGSEMEFSHSSDIATEMDAQEDETEKELDCPTDDETEKANSSENNTPKKSPHDAQIFQTPCIVGWVYNRDLSTCYRYYHTKMNWIQAEIYCQKYAPGGHLVSIHWEEHNQFIQNLIKHNNSAQTSTWIGLSDCHKEGIYLWTDGSATDFTKWKHDQPEDKEERGNCVITNSEDTGGTWDDRVCSDELPFVCGYKLL